MGTGGELEKGREPVGQDGLSRSRPGGGSAALTRTLSLQPRRSLAVTNDNAPTAAAELLTLEEAAAALRTPVATLRYWRHLGVGPDGFRLGRRVVYRRVDVDRWVAERQQAQSPRE